MKILLTGAAGQLGRELTPLLKEFGDLVRVRYVGQDDSTDFKHFSNIYMHADFADLNGDQLVDVIYSPSAGDRLHFYLNSGRRDAGGMPVFVADRSVPRQTNKWHPCRAVDLDQDGAIDFVVGDLYLRNTNPKGWPVELAGGVALDCGKDPCFIDLDGDGQLDMVLHFELDETTLEALYSQLLQDDVDGDGLLDPVEKDLRRFCEADDPRDDLLCSFQDNLVAQPDAIAIIAGPNGIADSYAAAGDEQLITQFSGGLSYSTPIFGVGYADCIQSVLLGDDEYISMNIIPTACDSELGETDVDVVLFYKDLFGFNV